MDINKLKVEIMDHLKAVDYNNVISLRYNKHLCMDIDLLFNPDGIIDESFVDYILDEEVAELWSSCTFDINTLEGEGFGSLLLDVVIDDTIVSKQEMEEVFGMPEISPVQIKEEVNMNNEMGAQGFTKIEGDVDMSKDLREEYEATIVKLKEDLAKASNLKLCYTKKVGFNLTNDKGEVIAFDIDASVIERENLIKETYAKIKSTLDNLIKENTNLKERLKLAGTYYKTMKYGINALRSRITEKDAKLSKAVETFNIMKTEILRLTGKKKVHVGGDNTPITKDKTETPVVDVPKGTGVYCQHEGCLKELSLGNVKFCKDNAGNLDNKNYCFTHQKLHNTSNTLKV